MAPGKIVLMACGSFSPPTFMHLRMFEIAKDYISSMGLGMVVGGIMSPVHDSYGKKDLVDAHHRIAMLKMAVKSSGWVKVSEWETQQAEWTRTRVSLKYHQDTINKHYTHSNLTSPPPWLPDDILNTNCLDEPDNLMEKLNGNVNCCADEVQVKLLCGADLLESFAKPGLWADADIETIVGNHGLVVITRSGSDPGKFIHESDILYKLRHNITLITNYITNEVSSTVLRRLMRRNESAKYLTDDGVIAYIKQNKLYGSKSYTEYSIIRGQLVDSSPDDVSMSSPDECQYKVIQLHLREKPIITDVTIKKPRKTILKPTQTDSVTPIQGLKPQFAYADTPNIPGKAVKVTADRNSTLVQGEKVCNPNTSNDKHTKPKNDGKSTLNTVNKVGSVTKTVDKPKKISEKKPALIAVEKTAFSTASTLNLTCKVNEGSRRKSDGFVDAATLKQADVKKRCSASTIKKLSKENIKKSKSEMGKLCDKMKNVKIKDEPKCYKTRSCNDIVKLVLTKHGIHVISDTEAIL